MGMEIGMEMEVKMEVKMEMEMDEEGGAGTIKSPRKISKHDYRVCKI
jgi:hypothetical protein